MTPKRIRTHIITGFLGVGKTTAILNLLKQKPADEKWAVLVNEFGEVGVDGAILQSLNAAQSSSEAENSAVDNGVLDNGVVVKEIPGGCLCCVSGLPFQMGLNLLIAKEQPDVLLIEPTGLGHPRNILSTLRNDYYCDILHIGASLCLLDPRHLSQPRYIEHETFADQIQLADVLVANKTDLCSEQEQKQFEQLLRSASPKKSASAWVCNGEIDITLLDNPADEGRLALHPNAHHHGKIKAAKNAEQSGTGAGIDAQPALADDEDWRLLKNHGQGHFSLGWLIQGRLLFSAKKLRDWLSALDVERAKGLLNTDEGAMVFNLRDGVLSEMPTRALAESRLELIDRQPLDEHSLQQSLQSCINV